MSGSGTARPFRRPRAVPPGIGLVAAAVLLASLAVSPLSAQQPAGQGAEAQAAADTTREDDARTRIHERLDELGRRPESDSARIARDSAALAERRSGPADDERQPPATPGEVGVQDEISSELLQLEGYDLTGYSARSAEFDAERGELLLRGEDDERPRVAREGMSLDADSAIVYDERQERVRAVGGAEYTPERGDPVASRTMVVDLRSERATALGANTRYAQGGTEWFVQGDLPSVAPEIVHGSHARFTSCDLEEPHYHFATDEIKIHAGNVLVARPVRLYFADVPVAWLPFVAQSLAEGRASGLLTPRFSVNDIVRTSRGYSRRISNVGFYWAMSDYTDLTVALDWFSDNFTAVTSNFRYEWMRQFLRGHANVRRFWSADGSTEFAFDSGHQWEITERTRLALDARYTTSTDFIRRNSFDPREVTQTIRSQGGLNHRFDWGSLNLGADRNQFLSDDRVETTLPNASLSLNPVTFFDAPAARAGFFNNITWNGSVGGTRRTREFNFDEEPPLDELTESQLDRVDLDGNASSSFTVGNFSISQNASYSAGTVLDVPDFFLTPPGEEPPVGEEDPDDLPPPDEVERIDLTREEVGWSAGINYQQRLVGSTTLTPRLQLSGRSIRSDTLSLASGFVAAPMRASLGVRLKGDAYGFFGGFGSFDLIRHKISPEISYDYSPEVSPTALQREVFRASEAQARSIVSVNLNQTFEARVEEEEEAPAEEAEEEAPEDGEDADDAADAEDEAPDEEAEAARPDENLLDDEGLERLDTGRKVMLLGLNTSVVTYDFVRADEAGFPLAGFTTTRLQNSIRSDYLRGLSVQFAHDLFRDTGDGEGDLPGGRTFAPHLSSMNLSLSFDSRSALFRWIGLGGDGDDEDPAPLEPGEEEEEEDDPFADLDGGVDETSIVPAGEQAQPQQRSSGNVGEWNASLSYALQRPRDPELDRNQTIQASVGFQPTTQWDVNWRTSFDVERRTFNDHMIRLTRDLHRWEANFDFRRTATGNWSFRFEVRLLDNQDLKFDYEQRSGLQSPR